MALLDDNPRTYQAWAQEYYEQPIKLKAVEHIYQHRPLTTVVVAALNDEMALEDLAEDIAEIGYPGQPSEQ